MPTVPSDCLTNTSRQEPEARAAPACSEPEHAGDGFGDPAPERMGKPPLQSEFLTPHFLGKSVEGPDPHLGSGTAPLGPLTCPLTHPGPLLPQGRRGEQETRGVEEAGPPRPPSSREQRARGPRIGGTRQLCGGRVACSARTSLCSFS